MDRALRVVTESIERNSLAGPRDRILVAFSGGADSTALTFILKALGYDIVLGHVNHQMRPDSGADARYCTAVAAQLDLPIGTAVVEVDPPTEAQARQVRYEALELMASECGAGLIATGHTMDDQAETVVMRIDRGGFPKGIPARRGRIVRPLLDLRRADTEAVCAENGLEFLVDPSNADEHFHRNFIRHRVMPDLEEAIPDLVRLASTAEAAAVRTLPPKVVAPEPAEPIILPEVEVVIPGTLVSEEWAVGVEAEVIPAPEEPDPDPNTALIDAALVRSPLVFRQRRDGDRFFPLGMSGRKKVQDFLVDEKVPRIRRDRIPVFIAGGEIVWIAGYRIDHRVRLTVKSEKALRLRVFPLLRPG